MSRIKAVPFSDFEILLESAQREHREKNEPIPRMYENNAENIKHCLQVPFSTFGGRLLYSGFASKAAILFYTMIKSHPLQNGNKRMAILTVVWFAAINNRLPVLSNDDLYELATSTSKSDSADMENVFDGLTKLFTEKFGMHELTGIPKGKKYILKLKRSSAK